MKTVNYKMNRSIIKEITAVLFAVTLCYLAGISPVYANNVQVTDITMTDENLETGTLKINFKLSQENPFGELKDAGNNYYTDYIWVFIKYTTLPLNNNYDYMHATLTPFSGVTGVSGSSVGSYSTSYVSNNPYSNTYGEGVTGDGKGAFIKASRATGQTFSVLWKFIDDEVKPDAQVKIKVFAIEMVFIPKGAFFYNVGTTGANVTNYNNYVSGSPTLVSSPADIPTGAVLEGTPDPLWPNGLNPGWPNGFNPFYIMKYEVTQEQYISFLNTLSFNNQDGWAYYYPYRNYAYNGLYWGHCGINRGGSPDADGGYWYLADPMDYTNRSDPSKVANRACPYFGWSYATAYASWAGLRPMTEMEFEKAARGSKQEPIPGQAIFGQRIYPWGNTSPSTGNSTYSPDGIATIYKYYGNTDSGTGASNVGQYLSGDIISPSRTPEQTGASPYGVADLTGNLWEFTFNCLSTLTPRNGDGKLHASYSEDLNWSMTDGDYGIRGGSFRSGSTSYSISQRNWGATASARTIDSGFRAVRTPG